MTSRNIYLAYKKDTSRLLYWIINISNAIVQTRKQDPQHASVKINTSGRSTIPEIVGMSKLIAENLIPIPSTILELFKAVIRAQSHAWAAFQQIANEAPNEEVERSNAIHKDLISTLAETLSALSGNSMDLSNPSSSNEETDDERILQKSLSALSLETAKSLKALSLDTAKKDEDEGSSEEDSLPAQVKTQGQKRYRKGRRRKRGKSKQTQLKPSLTIPLERFCIIEDETDLVSEYLVAVFAVTCEWVELGSFTQDLWREVAYDGLHGAIAATLTSTAVARVKKTCTAAFTNFPGHGSYEDIIRTITRGDPNKAWAHFTLNLYYTPEGDQSTVKVGERILDLKEHLWIHTYNDLITFLDDFRKNHTWKPTKALSAQLKHWSPTFDLQHAKHEERLSWRRSYTINWLYDLVNQFSSVAVDGDSMRDMQHVHEMIDWSPNGPWHQHRRLFGLNDFAGVITGLAMQKDITDIRSKILPHHVFQLQCIVDSFAASRGWTLDPLRGHLLVPPPPDFHTRRDIDLFLDHEENGRFGGLFLVIDILKHLLKQDAERSGVPKFHDADCDNLTELKDDLVNWLGQSTYLSDSDTSPPSRFWNHNTNGFLEFCPLLCATGLVEGMSLVQRVCLQAWDMMSEPLPLLHLHHMLVQKGVLEEPIGLYATLQDIFEGFLFPYGIPTKNFKAAYKACLDKAERDPRPSRYGTAGPPHKATDLRSHLNDQTHYYFKDDSLLTLYADADWLPERIPDSALPIPSMLHLLRLMYTDRVTDSDTQEVRLKYTGIVARLKAKDITDAELLDIASMPAAMLSTIGEDIESHHKRKPEAPKPPPSSSTIPQHSPTPLSNANQRAELPLPSLLDALRLDIFADVCGRRPMSALNFALITIYMISLFKAIDKELARIEHPIWLRVHSTHKDTQARKQALGLALLGAEDDDEVLRIVASRFETWRMSAEDCSFWGRRNGQGKREGRGDGVFAERCPVM